MEFKHDPFGLTLSERLGISDEEVAKLANATLPFLSKLGLFSERDRAVLFIKDALEEFDKHETALFFFLAIDLFRYLNVNGVIRYEDVSKTKDVVN